MVSNLIQQWQLWSRFCYCPIVDKKENGPILTPMGFCFQEHSLGFLWRFTFSNITYCENINTVAHLLSSCISLKTHIMLVEIIGFNFLTQKFYNFIFNITIEMICCYFFIIKMVSILYPCENKLSRLYIYIYISGNPKRYTEIG